jgi:rhodanese-related sulfurtransferase
MSDGSGFVIDVREKEELEQARIDGVKHIPLGELHLRVDEIPADSDVYMLCHVGQRSQMATDFLRQLGHRRVWNIRGGIIGWARAGLPLEIAERR